nr:trithorax group protein osa-like [Ipomoea batatas]
MMVRPLTIILALLSLLSCCKPHEATRVLREDEEIWMRKKHFLFLPSKGDMKKKKLQVLLPCLWKQVSSPNPNPGTNSHSSPALGEKRFARSMRKQHLLLPSLKWRPVNSPSSNPGHNKGKQYYRQ